MRRTTHDALRAASKITLVPVEDILTPRKTRELVCIRAAVSIVARHDLKRSLPVIGLALGRDHTSVHNLLRRYADRDDVRKLVERIRRKMQESTWRERSRERMEAASAGPPS